MEKQEQAERVQLGAYVRSRRSAAGLGVRALARAADVNPTWVSRLEHGEYDRPDPRLLARLADVLGLDLADLYLGAGYRSGEGLPGFTPYLRAKYDLPPEAVDQLAAHFELINERYAREQEGDHHGQDHHNAA